MEIDIKLQQQGITENIINFFHSRTNNSHMTIIKAYPAVTYKGEENAGVKINVTLQCHGIIQHAQYTIDLAKIRQKRLNLLLKTK